MVYASNFHIYYIANCVVMHDFYVAFSDIINVHLYMFMRDYKFPVYDLHEVEYHVSSE